MVSPKIISNLINTSQKTDLRSQHAAVVMYKGAPISYGYNHFDCLGNSIHAEQHALHNFLRNYSQLVGFLPKGEGHCFLHT